MDIMAVYKLTFEDGRVYVGGSKRANARGAAHLKMLRKGVHPIADMQTAFLSQSVTVEIIEIATSIEELAERERFWIKRLRATDPKYGFNCYNGGTGIREKVEQPSLSEANRRRWADPEYNARVSLAISKARKGQLLGPNSEEVRERKAAIIRARAPLQVGKKASVETRARMSASRLGKKRGPYKNRGVKTGPRSEETKKRIKRTRDLKRLAKLEEEIALLKKKLEETDGSS